jgi:squalene-associated FAD-dependent desaturase
MRIAIIGAGWSGLSCAIELVQLGHTVTVLEASPLVGGRAKTVELKAQSSISQSNTSIGSCNLDNGQHILIGAYKSSLQLMQKIGLNTQTLFFRQTLSMHFPNGKGLSFPNIGSPWNALVGIMTAKGWSLADKFSLLKVCSRWQLSGFKCDANTSVQDLAKGCSSKVFDELLEPICISALNISASLADGQLFLNVIKDTLFAGFGASDFLIPMGDLSDTFATPAVQWLKHNGAEVLTHHRVLSFKVKANEAQTKTVEPSYKKHQWQIQLSPNSQNNEALDLNFDHIVLACNAPNAAQILASSINNSSPETPTTTWSDASHNWLKTTQNLVFNSITTVYLSYDGPPLPQLMMALNSSPKQPAQFVFDKAQLGGPAGILAFVISASQSLNCNNEQLAEAVLSQASAIFPDSQLALFEVITEKRATFSCHVGHQRPTQQIANKLWACGDYVHEKYPATLEAAVQTGQQVAQQIHLGL